MHTKQEQKQKQKQRQNKSMLEKVAHHEKIITCGVWMRLEVNLEALCHLMHSMLDDVTRRD